VVLGADKDDPGPSVGAGLALAMRWSSALRAIALKASISKKDVFGWIYLTCVALLQLECYQDRASSNSLRFPRPAPKMG
jgi:hypothetical protein